MQIRKGQRRVYLELSATRFEFAAFDGRNLVGHHAARPSTSALDGDWADLLREFEVELTAWSAAHDLRGLRTTVVYSGPDTTALLSSCPASAGERRAALAARMILADTVSFTLEQNAHVELHVCRDRNAAEGEAPQLHTIGVADTESALIAMSQAIGRAGLVADEFIPAPAANLAAAVRAVPFESEGDAPRVVLWIGNQTSGVAAVASGALAFARQIPVGIETLVEALARPVSSQQSESAPLIERDAGRELLLQAGIPGPDGWSDKSVTLDSRAVLPLLQPVLQRLVIELKQSIRFGLTAEARGSAELELAGPGASVPGVTELLSSGLGFPAVHSSKVCVSEESTGDIVTVRALGAAAPRLTPKEIAASNLARSTGRALLVGCAIGVLAIAIDAGHSWTQLRAATATLETIDVGALDEGASVVATRDTAVAAQAGVRGAESRIAAQLGESAPFGAMMRALAAITPQEVELLSMDFRESAEGVECVLRGVVAGDSEESETDRFRRYTDALQACPLVRETQLGETRRMLDGDSPSLSFAVTLRLVTLPESGRLVAAASQGERTP
ncbi:MAG: hypothetical protein Q9O74_07535 [Planctomycetota bacterium]|nr:hypothetical protein [Planctomycetota bacterium]